MAFDQATRNRLSRFVADSRSLLTEEFTRQLQSVYGMDPKSGDIADLSRLPDLDDSGQETARLLRDTVTHYLSAHDVGVGAKAVKARRDVLERIIREQAFTVLNRLCALRMAESRGILIESVSKGYQSKGFQLYQRMAGPAFGETGVAYQMFLFGVFDEFAVDLAVLFDRFSPSGRLFPREAILLSLLKELNAPDLESLWAEDETIGWIYQYWNSKEERQAMRKASSAPRNSRELAVRNQFFTPRYVVEFLADNTLGRIWYEMTKGETRLRDQCRYLVRRPTEIFQVEGETAPDTPEQEGLSQEELLRQPVHIPHRPVKDPRDIRLLDPACGSMHFGLYAFDLFESIYEEAWDNGSCPSLQESYSSKGEFLTDVPRLVIENNIHGIDIDPRAVQIAGLSLWLRAQKAWQARGVDPSDRPRVLRSNIVCAEPMPGNAEMLEDFVATLHPPLLGELVRTVFDKMRLAGEAGSLLKIEEEIRTAIDTARKAWEKLASRPPELFTVEELNRSSRQMELSSLDQAIASSRDLAADFWDTAERRVIAALRAYAEHADVDSYQRRLFADDAAQGFAFIDLCQRRYDAVVMNPPFGESVTSCKCYYDEGFPEAVSDIGMMFVSRFSGLLRVQGRLGAITNRTCLATSQLEKWRRSCLLGDTPIELVADLGYGVLDGAMVEACAYIVGKEQAADGFPGFRLLDSREKSNDLRLLVQRWCNGASDSRSQLGRHDRFRELPLAVISYWAPLNMVARLTKGGRLGDLEPGSNDGGHTGDDFRFVRSVWEVKPRWIGRSARFVYFAKGGEYSPMWDDIHLVEYWRDNGREVREISGARIYHEDLHFAAGLTYPLRTTSDFSPRVLPSGSMFSTGGHGIHFREQRDAVAFLGFAYTRLAKVFVEVLFGGGDASVSGSAARNYTAGTIKMLPMPTLDAAATESVVQMTKEVIAANRIGFRNDETTRYFVFPACVDSGASMNDAMRTLISDDLSRHERVGEIMASIERLSFDAFGIRETEVTSVLETVFGRHPSDYSKRDVSDELPKLLEQSISDLMETAAATTRSRNRSITKKSYFINRTIDLLCHALSAHPSSICAAWMELPHVPRTVRIHLVAASVSYLLGTGLGRWDIRYASGARQPPELPDPFDPLPVCPPGMLQNPEGLPAEPNDVPTDYPLRISWPGILVDDENHQEDIVTRVLKAVEVIWKDRAEAIEQEACEILGVRTLRDYFRRPAGFFADHLKRYSKSRRQAPIYWPLSTRSGSYTLWLYYHRLTDQTLYSCVNDFVEPKLKIVTDESGRLKTQTNRSSADERRLEELTDLELELREFRDELLRIAKFWKPNLNDGVQITAAPLWKLFQLKKWQSTLKETWEKLEAGEYDWAHLAFSIWPERVVRASHNDRSFAIAHDLEDLLWHEAEVQKKGKGGKVSVSRQWQPRHLSEEELNQIIAEARQRPQRGPA